MANRIKHTLESCRAAAQGCQSRKQFMAKDRNAYDAARRNGWLDEICPKQAQPEAWTKERVAEVSKLYASRSEMKRSPHQWALKVARQNGWFDALPHEGQPGAPSTIWTKELCLLDALNYTHRSAWAKHSCTAYDTARTNNWLAECCKHMAPVKRYNETELLEIAKKYKSRSQLAKQNPKIFSALEVRNLLDIALPKQKTIGAPIQWTEEKIYASTVGYEYLGDWRLDFPGAYHAAYHKKLLDDIKKNLKVRVTYNDNDTFYLWKAKDTYYNGLPVYKFGITSARLEKKRIREVAKASGLTAEVLLYVPLEQAPGIERIAAGLGQDPVFDRFDGYTEFRAYSQNDIATILAALQQAGVAII